MTFGHRQHIDVICYVLQMTLYMCQEMGDVGEDRREEEEEE